LDHAAARLARALRIGQPAALHLLLRPADRAPRVRRAGRLRGV